MRPKPPATTNPPRINLPDTPVITPPHLRPDGEAPLLRPPLPGTLRPGDLPDISRPGTSIDHTVGAASVNPRVEIIDMPAAALDRVETAPPMTRYLLNSALLRGMQPADAEGFRYIVGRKFVDVKDAGTVYVEFDASAGTYRAMDLYKKLPSGPALYKLDGEAIWSPEPPSTSSRKRPHPEDVDLSDPPAKRVKPPHLRLSRNELINDVLPRLFPDKTPEAITQSLRAYNLSPAQHARLRQDLLKNLRMPDWAEQHKTLTLDVNASDRFEHLHAEIEPLILPLRNGTGAKTELLDFEESVTKDFLDAFLARLGYLRNKNDCLYRTDIPGLFRADERTPFELVNNGWMLPRMKHPTGATSEKPISATVSQQAVKTYGSGAPDPEYLTYNSQMNKYPGRRPGDSDADSDSDANGSSSDSEWSDSDVSLDSERDYETARHNQRFVLTYVIDTRNMEVVLAEENDFFNLAAKEKGAWFPEDDLEALISASRRGIHTDRLWLLDSSLTRAAKVDDVVANADEGIERRTHAGVDNRYEYDGLIDRAAAAGKPILTLDAGKDWFANDIVWPE